MKRIFFLLLLAGACRSNRGNDQLPFVQFSSDEPASRFVTITARDNYSPPCLTINVGDTVEWDNPTGHPINVTSAAIKGLPPELFSPSLVSSASKWRHTFRTSGRIDYFNQGASGGGAVDPYYGTRTPGAGATTSASGTVCVRNADGSGCDQLCCIKGGDPAQCGSGICSVPADPEIAFGFCMTAASTPLDLSTTD